MEVKTHKISCCECGVLFWITDAYDDMLRRTHNSFYCPNGHSQSYKGETEGEKYKKLYKDEKKKAHINLEMYLNCSEDRSATKRQLSATQGVVTRMRNKRDG